MWMVELAICCGGLIVGILIGMSMMKQANDAYKRQINQLLKDNKAPYEVVVKQEVKSDDSSWW